MKDLERYPEYLEFRSRKKSEGDGEQHESASAPLDSQSTPQEELQRIFDAIQDHLELELLDALKTTSPTFFERVLVRLLVAMGYGGSIEDAGRATKRTGDDGIDGESMKIDSG